ncbi:GSCOCG00009565001-RA-CDS [Cotesia congregata]|nr:GSCOCG00009565001-RA-CDS [Cotesia congregata]
MTLKIFSKLFTFLMVLNNVQTFNLTDIYDLNSINHFFDDISTKVKNEYLSNELITDGEKNIILNKIVIDLIGILTKLDDIKSDFDDNYLTQEFDGLMKSFEIYNSKLRDFESYSSLIARKKIIDEKRYTIETYVKWIVSFQNDTELQSLINFCPFISKSIELIDSVFHSDSIAEVLNELIDNISKKIETNQYNICGQRSSLNEGWFFYYRQTMTAFLKKMVIYYYFGVIDARCKNEQQNDAMTFLKTNSIEILTKSLKSSKQLQQMNYYMYQCDAFDLKKGKIYGGYYQLERMIQTMVINEKDLSADQSCWHNCKLNKMEGNINHTECKEFYDCRFMSYGFHMCNEKKESTRRYQWFKDNHDIHFGPGREKKCNRKIELLGSYIDLLQLRHCDYCVCTCVIQPKRSNNVVTAISFRDQVTNIYENMVVVGVRFVKKDFMIHIQIKERPLRRRGLNDSGSWKELESFDVNEQTGRFVLINNNTESPLFVGIDYGNPRIINFDDLIAPKGFVVTGVRLGFVENTLDYRQFKTKPIELQIRVTPFDYIQGQLIDLHRTYWIALEHQSHHDRKHLNLPHPDDPTKSSENVIDSKTNQFIKFRASDLKKDAGQSTVPFFDALEAEGDPNFPLGGIGIIHRGQKGFGGFLALKIFELDLSKYFKT